MAVKRSVVSGPYSSHGKENKEQEKASVPIFTNRQPIGHFILL